jgi:hypothetical protein
MRPPARELALPAAVAVVGALFLAWLGLKTMAFSDYELEAEPALLALLDGDLQRFLDLLPAYGGSLVLRSPFAFLPELWGGGDWALYRSMAAPCLAAGVALGLVLWTRAERLGRERKACWAALLLCAVNPLTLRALEIGHPEELLGATLCVGAALAAASRRPLLAGALLGLAVANKPWAVLAVVPVAILAPEGRWRLLGLAGLVVAGVLGPLWLAGSGAVDRAGDVARDTGVIFQPWQVWWFLGDHGQVVMGSFAEKPGFRTAPGWIGEVARPVVLLVPVALSLALARRLRARPWHDGLLLLALVLLLRCLLDPWNVVYYELPFLLALIAWEVHARQGLPVVSLAATLLCWLTLEQFTLQLSPDAQSLAFLAWSVPFALALALRLCSPELWQRLTARLSLTLRAAGPPRAASPDAPRG